MSIFQRIKKAGKKTLAGIVLSVGLLSGCGGSSTPVNHAPEFTSNPMTTATENSQYNYDADATDQDGDSLTYSLVQAPAGMTIDSSTGLIQWIPNDSQSAQTHQIKVQVSDGINTTEQDYSIYAVNTEDIHFSVNDILSDNPVEDAYIDLGGINGTTTSGGDCTIPDVPDGEYLVWVTNSNYYPHRAGKLIVNKQKGLEGKLDINFEIIPTTFNMNFFDEVCRSYNGSDGQNYVGAGNGETQRISDEDMANWVVYIDTNPAYGSGNPVTQENIDTAVNVIETYWPIFTHGKLNPTVANGRIQIGTNPPPYPSNLVTSFRWNDTVTTGGHCEKLNGSDIYASGVDINTSAIEHTNKEEEFQVLGNRIDSELELSILNDGGPEDYTQADYDTMDILYSRPSGNTTPDNNPINYIINP